MLKNHTKCGKFMPPICDGWFLTASERDEQDYISNCKNAAEDIAQQMIKKRLEGYCIENGKRQYLRGIVPCKAIPTDGIKVFTNTLAAKLSHAKVIV